MLANGTKQEGMMQQRKLLSQRHPILYFLAVWVKRLKRIAEWHLGNKTWACRRNAGEVTV
jgi:vancomycin resistance protein VanW